MKFTNVEFEKQYFYAIAWDTTLGAEETRFDNLRKAEGKNIS